MWYVDKSVPKFKEFCLPYSSWLKCQVKKNKTKLESSKKMLYKVILEKILIMEGFPGGSDSKESSCNAGDLGLIPGL